MYIQGGGLYPALLFPGCLPGVNLSEKPVDLRIDLMNDRTEVF